MDTTFLEVVIALCLYDMHSMVYGLQNYAARQLISFYNTKYRMKLGERSLR